VARIRKQIAEGRVVPGEVVFEKLRKRGIEV